jgi:ribosomal silencing factor RsfS
VREYYDLEQLWAPESDARVRASGR